MDIKKLIQQNNIHEDDKNILYNEPISKHTSFKIGGPADVFIKATSVDTIKKVVEIANSNNIPLHIIGNGSNVLVKDEGVRGIVLKPQLTDVKIKIVTEIEEQVLKKESDNQDNSENLNSSVIDKLKQKKSNNSIIVTAQSGALMGAIGYTLMQNSITGFEELAGIPGTIGGAIRMNAGAHGKEIKDICSETTYIDMQGELHTLTNEQQQFTYRSSIFAKQKYIILETKLQLHKGNQQQIKNKMEQYLIWRKEHQPLEYPNAGSTFKRGSDFITAELIDKCGLKGYKIGGAQVSTKHAGFVVNTGGATAQNVLDVINHVKSEVLKQTGKTIKLEIEII